MEWLGLPPTIYQKLARYEVIPLLSHSPLSTWEQREAGNRHSVLGRDAVKARHFEASLLFYLFFNTSFTSLIYSAALLKQRRSLREPWKPLQTFSLKDRYPCITLLSWIIFKNVAEVNLSTPAHVFLAQLVSVFSGCLVLFSLLQEMELLCPSLLSLQQHNWENDTQACSWHYWRECIGGRENMDVTSVFPLLVSVLGIQMV